MSLKLFCHKIVWSRQTRVLEFQNCFLGKRGKRFQVDNTRLTVFDGESVYLCKIRPPNSGEEDEYFKFFVLDQKGVEGLGAPNCQLAGKNVRGKFVFDDAFAEGVKYSEESIAIEKIDLSEKTEQ